VTVADEAVFERSLLLCDPMEDMEVILFETRARARYYDAMWMESLEELFYFFPSQKRVAGSAGEKNQISETSTSSQSLSNYGIRVRKLLSRAVYGVHRQIESSQTKKKKKKVHIHIHS